MDEPDVYSEVKRRPVGGGSTPSSMMRMREVDEGESGNPNQDTDGERIISQGGFKTKPVMDCARECRMLLGGIQAVVRSGGTLTKGTNSLRQWTAEAMGLIKSLPCQPLSSSEKSTLSGSWMKTACWYLL